MEALFILLPATLLIASLFVGLFIYFVSKGQFENSQSGAHRILFEDKLLQSENDINNDKNKDETKDDKKD